MSNPQITPCDIINVVQSLDITEFSQISLSAQALSLFAVSIALEKKANQENNKLIMLYSLYYKLLAKRLISGL